jgi:hypothetical protein
VAGVLRDIAENWHVYATMPVIAALIGYVTKRAAIEMMYRPLEFVGVKPFLGWQGSSRATPSGWRAWPWN